MATMTPTGTSNPQPAQDTHLWEYVLVMLRRRRLALSVFLAVLTLGGLRVVLTRPVYSATADILIEREKSNVLTFKEVAEIDSARDDYYQTQYKLLQSRVLVRRVVESMNLLMDPEFGGPRPKAQVEAALAAPAGESALLEDTIDAFLKRLYVQAVRNSRIVRVSFDSYRPELAAQAANRLAELYIKQSLDFRFRTSSDASQWLGGQIEGERKKMESAEAALGKLKEREGLVNYEERRTLLEQKLKELGTALNERKTERLQKEALYRQMAGAPNREELPEVMRSPLVQNLRIELASLERQQAQLLDKYLDQHPEVVKVRSQITETRRKIAGEADRVIRSAYNDYKAVASQEASVEAALEAAKKEAADLERRGLQYESAKREVEAGKQVLNSLLSRSKETDVASELKSSNIRVVDPAVVPQKPVRPRPLRDLLLSFVLAALLSVVAVFCLEYLDSSLKTPEDVRTHLTTPLLGVIPEIDHPAQVLIGATQTGSSHELAPFHEGYRVVRTALNYSWPEAGPRVVVVTSTAPREGKTLSTVNLGATIAAQADRVLLLDCDLRNPQVHNLVRLKKTPGLSDVLVGRAKPSEAIQRLAYGNLSVLPAGTKVPSPADLLTSQSMRALLESLREFFRWVIIDTPPVGSVSEALVLAPIADGVVVVGGAEMVPRKAILHTLHRLEATGARVLGLMLNRARIDKHSYYYSRYYGHYYGHYQGEGEPKKEGPGAGRPAPM